MFVIVLLVVLVIVLVLLLCLLLIFVVAATQLIFAFFVKQLNNLISRRLKWDDTRGQAT